MRLTDRVDVLTTTDGWASSQVEAPNVRAEVHYQSVATVVSGGRTSLVEELRAILEPRAFSPTTNRIKWRGQVYATNGPPMVRRRNGRDHHITVPLIYVSG